MHALWRGKIESYREKQSTQTRNFDSNQPRESSHIFICEWLQYFTKLLKLTYDRHTYSQSWRCILLCKTINAINSLLYFTFIKLFMFNQRVFFLPVEGPIYPDQNINRQRWLQRLIGLANTSFLGRQESQHLLVIKLDDPQQRRGSSGQFGIINDPSFRLTCREWDFSRCSNWAARRSEIRYDLREEARDYTYRTAGMLFNTEHGVQYVCQVY